jgi:uncharacterized coiled-coil protein SlyX
MAKSTDERLIELEAAHMHLEKLVDQLNEVVTLQHAELERLKRTVAALREQLAGLTAGAPDEKPPHY